MDIINLLQGNLNFFNIDIEFIVELLELNIQTIGIFIAIVGGLIATKIISLNTEKDEINENIDSLNMEIEHMTSRLNEKMQKNEEMYRNEVYDEMVDMIFDEDCENTILDNYNPFISVEQRKNFKEEVLQILRDRKDIIEKLWKHEIGTREEFLEKCKVSNGTMEYKILDYMYDKYE